jgi:urease accessory protein
MLAPAAPSLLPGAALLRVEQVDGRSTVTRCQARSPARLLTPIHRGEAAWCYVPSFGGGLVAGDHLDLRVELGPGARAQLATQASTKVFKADGDACARQDLTAELAAGSLLVNLPAHVTIFRAARFRAHNRYQLEPGANLLALDWFSAGRGAYDSQEVWAGAELATTTSVSWDQRERLREAIELAPAPGLPDPAQRMGPVRAMASVIVLGPLLEPVLSAITAASAEPVRPEAELQHSCSPLPGGCLWRLAAQRVELLAQTLAQTLRPVAALLGDDPWRRGGW